MNCVHHHSLFDIVALLIMIMIIDQPSANAGQMGFDASVPITIAQMQCLKQNNYSFAIPRIYHSYGAVDIVGVQNVKNAYAGRVHLCVCR